jgi:hypothetical protein
VAEDVARLQQALRASACEVLILDPLYLSLLNGNRDFSAANLYDMGPLLLSVSRACLDVGCTPLLVHHANRQLKAGEVMELEHLAFAGVQEFARQWLLLSRREKYQAGSGTHKLWLSYGGSAGQSGCRAVDVEEGQLLENFTGRRWDVVVRRANEAIQAQRDAKEAAKEDKKVKQVDKDKEALLRALDDLDKDGKGASLEQVREAANLGSRSCTRMPRAVEALVEEGVIEAVTVQVPTGRRQAATREAAGIRRCHSGDEGESLSVE